MTAKVSLVETMAAAGAAADEPKSIAMDARLTNEVASMMLDDQRSAKKK
jgi:hypothetical protein